MCKKLLTLLALAALLGASVALPVGDDFDIGTRRIVNGTSTSIEQVPFQVSILFFNSQWCGASILDQNTILTAAHCFDYYWDKLYELNVWSIRAGSSYWGNGGVVVNIASAVSHKDYNPNTYDFDIAILKLSTPLTFSPSIQPVVLAEASSTLAAGEMVQISGWGRLTHGGAIPEVLQKIVLPALSRSQCESLFININPITERMFCAGDLQGLGDSCNGDSGGPLVTLKNVQYGLVSWGLDCAMNGFTGVYTYLPYFRNWIEQNRR